MTTVMELGPWFEGRLSPVASLSPSGLKARHSAVCPRVSGSSPNVASKTATRLHSEAVAIRVPHIDQWTPSIV